jgi:integrase
MALKLPPYVHAFRDRHGKTRYYFRRRGFRRAPLPGLPYSSEFMRAYEAAAQTVGEFGSSRSRPGTVAAAVAGYFASSAFASLAESTRKDRRRILERFRDHNGGNAIATLTRRDVEALVEARKSRPGTALNFLVALRALMRHAVLVGLVDRDPTEGLRGPKFRSDGFYTWTEQDIAAFEARHPVGSRARLALALGLYTGQRRSDVIRMGRQHVRDDVVHVRQSKTGKSLAIPLHSELRSALQAVPANNMTFLTTGHGKPFYPDAFTHWFKRKCREAGLPARASFHGLRKAACRRLAELGCSVSVIASISGHSSLREVARYTAAADQARLARQGIEALTGTPSGKLGGQSGKPRSKALK